MTPRVVTGIGVLSPVGIGRAAFFEGLRAGVLGAGPPTTFDPTKYGGSPVVAEIPGFDAAKFLGEKGLRTLDRLTKLMVVAARLALEDAGLKKDGAWSPAPPLRRQGDAASSAWPDRIGLVASNAYGSIEAITELDRVAVLEDARYINPARFPLTVSNSAAGYVSIWEDLRALNVSVSDGNPGGLDAVTCADMLLASGRADVLLVGGAEALSEGLYAAFSRLGAPLATDWSKRGGREASDGPAFLGEAAGFFVLESREGAVARGARPLAEIVGFGGSFAPPETDGALLSASPGALEQAIVQALDDARIAPSTVDVVVSGIAGAAPFEHAELAAIARVVGSEAWVVAPKRAWGETLGAGGTLGVLAAIGCLREGVKSHGVRGVAVAEPSIALVTSLGYYGNASAVVVRAPG
jgi:3-oxoacyl-(acyl-carrier-protein) synthase